MEVNFLLGVQNVHNPVLNVLMKAITFSGDGGLIMIVTCLLLILFKKTRKCGITALISLVFTFIFANLIIKNVVHRPRPWTVADFDLLIKKPSEYSFPSGHTVNSFAVAVVIYKFYKKPGIAAIIYSFILGLSRIYLCVHYPTDVLAGMIIGTIDAIIVYTICKRIQDKKEMSVQEV